MTLETFFEKFDLLADAPGAVATMRELVLELAVEGRLVETAIPDEVHPAWTAFCLELSEHVYSDDPGPPPPFCVPDHWEWCVLDEVVDCRAGAKVAPAAIGDNDWVLDLEDIDGKTGQVIQFATFAQRRSLSTKAAFEAGDVLYGKLRPYLNKVVVAGKAGFCTTEIVPLRPAKFLLPEFLRFYLRSRTFLRYTAQKNYGMKMPRLGTKDLAAAMIPVPPPGEQKRIVAKVGELMALCDHLEAQQKERQTRHAALARASLARFAQTPTPDSLQFLFHPFYTVSPAELRKAILTLAVRGKLVLQDVHDETAARFLARMCSPCGTVGANHSVTFEKPFEVPSGWAWITMGDIVASMSNGIYKPAKFYSHTGTACVRMFNIQDGQLELGTLRRLDLTAGEVEQYRLSVGDLLLNRVNSRELVGKCAVVAAVDEPLVFEAMNIRIRLVEREHLPNFVNLVLRTDRVRELFQHTSKQAIGQASINQPQVASTPIPLPPLAEQRRIVAKVNQLMILVDQLDAQLATSRSAAEKLLEAIVAELTAGRYGSHRVSVEGNHS